MSKLSNVRINMMVNVEFSSKEIELLELLTSYDLTDWFVEKCNKSISKEVFREQLAPLRSLFCKLNTKRDELENFLNESSKV